jgi:hypothetical protein
MIDKPKEVVVSYWSGPLPEICYLHFLSFRKHNPEMEYVLYLEEDFNLEGSVSEILMEKLLLLDISIERIQLSKLMFELDVPAFSIWLDNSLYRFARRIIRKITPLFYRLGMRKGIFPSEVMGITLSHRFPFTGYSTNLPYRADLFRSLIHRKYIEWNFLYVDIDICFTAPIDFMRYPQGAIAQWGTDNFGNSAFLLLTSSARNARNLILQNLIDGVSALPWILYDKERIVDYQLTIIDNKYIDQAWSPKSIIFQDSSLFFKMGPHVDSFLEEVLSDSIGIHWHNQWKITPDAGSPYQRLVDMFERGMHFKTTSIK